MTLANALILLIYAQLMVVMLSAIYSIIITTKLAKILTVFNSSAQINEPIIPSGFPYPAAKQSDIIIKRKPISKTDAQWYDDERKN